VSPTCYCYSKPATKIFKIGTKATSWLLTKLNFSTLVLKCHFFIPFLNLHVDILCVFTCVLCCLLWRIYVFITPEFLSKILTQTVRVPHPVQYCQKVKACGGQTARTSQTDDNRQTQLPRHKANVMYNICLTSQFSINISLYLRNDTR